MGANAFMTTTLAGSASASCAPVIRYRHAPRATTSMRDVILRNSNNNNNDEKHRLGARRRGMKSGTLLLPFPPRRPVCTRAGVSDESQHTDFSKIPVVDIAPLCDPGSALESRLEVAAQLHDACREVGFFYVIGHGCPSGVSDGVRAAARAWFARPAEEKNRYKIRPGSEGRGYQGLGSNVTRYDGGFARDWHEALDLYKDFALDHPDVIAGRPLHVPNVRLDDAPELQASLDAWRDESLRMGAAILRGIALGLGLDEDFFTGERAGDPFWVMRVIHYPPLPSATASNGDGGGGGGRGGERPRRTASRAPRLAAPDDAAVAAAKEGAHLLKSVPLSCGQHTDYGLLTIVNQDAHATALQVQNAAGRWVDAPPLPGSFVCNIGDMLQIWTNGGG